MDYNALYNSFLEREQELRSFHPTSELLKWIEGKNITLEVSLKQEYLSECTPWFYSEKEGIIRNAKRTFFQISGIRATNAEGEVTEQPIIIQDEIGFLGIIACKINGIWHYLMQAKVEPGNVNNVQISPTIQATKSNFTQQHGGKKPLFLEYFLNMDPKDIIVDQIQSEQSSRFLGKRNRNVILKVSERLEETDSHRWMSLSQIKELMRHDNLVNMDTRTVLSCIPYVLLGTEGDVPFKNKLYFNKTAAQLDRQTIVNLYHQINNYKMFRACKKELIPLYTMKDWEMQEDEFVNKEGSFFKIIFCNIRIEGREVTQWHQPLFAATGIAQFGLLCCDDDGIMKFLVRVAPEIGCFDSVEIGPSVQREAGDSHPYNEVESLFYRKLKNGEGILANVLLSEEGGRFYQEQNRNVILFIDKEELPVLMEGYIWSDYGTLNILTQINNCVNIQLRNLLSILEI